MRNIIRKILKEELENIKRNELYNREVLPAIFEFIKERYGNGITVKHRIAKTFYGNDDYSGDNIKLMLYVENESLDPKDVKSEVWDGLNNFFNIDVRKYGSGIDIEVFKKKWEIV